MRLMVGAAILVGLAGALEAVLFRIPLRFPRTDSVGDDLVEADRAWALPGYSVRSPSAGQDAQDRAA